MAHVLVVGGGVAGLATALALGGAGHDVTVVERDDVSLPDSPDAAFASWPRRGAPQTRHSHAFLARLRNLLRDREPRLLADLLAAGATELRFTDHLPPEMEDREPRPGDEDLVALACRRTTFEWVLRRDAVHSRGVRLVQGTVAGLTTGTGPTGTPHVTGVVLADGGVMDADLVVDASGRRSPLPAWLEAVGVAPLEEREEDTGIIYSSRFYRLLPGADEPEVDGPIGGDLGYLKYAVFVGDNRTFSITFGLPSEDSDLRSLLREEPFTLAARALPVARAWLDVAEPITGVEVMARLLNRRRRFVVDGLPVVTGLVAVGDSNICTNPLYGRGCSLAFVQAYELADVLAAAEGDPVAIAAGFDAAIRREVEPWYRASVAQDRQERQARHPEQGPPADDGEGLQAPNGLDPESARSLLRDGVLPATRIDPLVYRAFLRMFNLLTPPDSLMTDPELIGRVLAVWQDRDNRPEPPVLGPGRDDLLRLLAA